MFFHKDFFDSFFQIQTGYPNLCPAGIALDAEIHPRPHDGEGFAAAGMRLLQFHNISDIQLQRHFISPFFAWLMLFRYFINAHIRPEHFRYHHRSVRLLVILQNRRGGPAYREAGTV